MARPMRPDTLPRFVLRVFLWMPVCFAAWYASAEWHGAVTGWFAHAIVGLFQPRIVEAVEQSGIDLVFVTRIPAQGSVMETGMLVIEVGPLIYSYGLALFLALGLASRTSWRNLLTGAAALLPFEAWGIAFDFLAQAGIKLGPQVSAQAGFSSGQREAIVFGYQVGSLIFPTLVPVAMWAALNRRFLEALLRAPRPGPPSVLD
jgi:hypothetical protein